MGDISSTIYPVHGGLEDWSYGAGWDTNGGDATLFACYPYTYQLPSNFSQKLEDYTNIRSAIYIVETDGEKRPSERELGGRIMEMTPSGKYRVVP